MGRLGCNCLICCFEGVFGGHVALDGDDDALRSLGGCFTESVFASAEDEDL